MSDRPENDQKQIYSAIVDEVVEFNDKAVLPGATTQTEGGPTVKTRDPMPLRRIDHVRLFVGNARQSAYFYRNAFGFDVVAYAGLETKTKHEAGYVLKQGTITFVLASPLNPSHPESRAALSNTATACRTSPSKSMTCATAYNTAVLPRRDGRHRADGAGRRARRV